MHRLAAFPAKSLLSSLAAMAVVAACGGGGSSDAPVGQAPPPGVPPVVQPVATPSAAFTAPTTGTVQTPIAFDASASTTTDGSALQYVWDFGDGVRGGGIRIAHAFSAGGTRSVTLTVIDANGRQGRITRGVDVAAAAAATGTVVVHAAVVDADGVALSGVAIGRPGSSTALGTTGATGLADITLDSGPLLVLRLTKSGYADQTSTVRLPVTAGTDTLVNAVMRPRDAAQTLADAHAGGSLTGRAGATITLPADALLTAGGALATGAVPISMTTVDPTLHGGGGFPGRFDGVKPDGTTTPIVSFGTVEFVLGDDANRLQLAPGKTATIELPVMANRKLDGSAVAVGDVIPLWSLDETTGIWIQEGTGTIVTNAGADSGLAMRAVVSHFSWWNADLGFDPYGPTPKCIYDGDIGLPEARDFFNTATICNMLAEIDRTLGGGNAAVARNRAAAATSTNPQIAGFARSTIIPIAGGQVIAVPANNNVALAASALNGTWAGRVVVNGAVGVQEEVVIRMRPIQAAAPTAEALALPVTGLARSVATGQVGRFTFTAGELQYARFQISAVQGSTVTGTARILQGATVLASAPFSNTSLGSQPASLLVAVPSAGSYTLELTVEQPSGLLITGELLGGVTNETIAVPTDVTKTIPTYGAYRAAFDLATPATLHIAAKVDVYNPKGEMRLTGPDGSVLWSRSNVGNINAEIADLALPTGRYVFTYSRTDVTPSTLRLTTEAIDWLPLAEGIAVDGTFSLVDLVADRNGRPVVGVLRHPVVNQTYSSTLQLRRFNGSAWEDIGGTITTSPLACGNHTTSFAFDSTNTPTIVYASRSAADVYSATARRLVGGVWQAIGPNDGVLPQSANACDDALSPRLVIDAADRPIVAYHGDSSIWIQRFDGTAWGKLAASAQDSFAVGNSAHDLAPDPAGTLWFVLRGNANSTETTVARRFDVPSGMWQTVGPSGGVLPESNTQGYETFRIGFDTAGRPVIGGTIAVLNATRTTASRGAAVYRFDGNNWQTTGGYQLPGSYINNTGVAGFALLGNDALMTWMNQYGSNNSAAVVQRDTPAGWSGFGTGQDGTLAAYTAHAATPGRTLSDGRLLVVGSDIYMAAIVPVQSSSSSNITFNLVLLKKTP